MPQYTINFQPQISLYDDDFDDIIDWTFDEMMHFYALKDINQYYKTVGKKSTKYPLTCLNFCPKMLSAFYVCCIYSNALQGLILHVREHINIFKLVEFQDHIPPKVEIWKGNFAMTLPQWGIAGWSFLNTLSQDRISSEWMELWIFSSERSGGSGNL